MQAVQSAGASPTSLPDIADREGQLMQRSGELLGVRKAGRQGLRSRFDVHNAIVNGAITYGDLSKFLGSLTFIHEGDVVHVLGVSARTLRRQRDTPAKSMPPDLASKAWVIAETLAKASDVFGSRDKAEEWMNKPALGLDGQRPIEMLQTAQGAGVVSDFLTRLEYGVYS